MKIIGIGNAIVDVICKVEEEFLKKLENIIYSELDLIN